MKEMDLHLNPIRDKAAALSANTSYVMDILKEGAKKARKKADLTVKEVTLKMGLSLETEG